MFTLVGGLLLMAGIWLFLSRRDFALRALAFLLLTLGGFVLLLVFVPSDHLSGLILLAALGLPVSLALAVLARFLQHRLWQLSDEVDPDAGEGRHD